MLCILCTPRRDRHWQVCIRTDSKDPKMSLYTLHFAVFTGYQHSALTAERLWLSINTSRTSATCTWPNKICSALARPQNTDESSKVKTAWWLPSYVATWPGLSQAADTVELWWNTPLWQTMLMRPPQGHPYETSTMSPPPPPPPPRTTTTSTNPSPWNASFIRTPHEKLHSWYHPYEKPTL